MESTVYICVGVKCFHSEGQQSLLTLSRSPRIEHALTNTVAYSWQLHPRPPRGNWIRGHSPLTLSSWNFARFQPVSISQGPLSLSKQHKSPEVPLVVCFTKQNESRNPSSVEVLKSKPKCDSFCFSISSNDSIREWLWPRANYCIMGTKHPGMQAQRVSRDHRASVYSQPFSR